jgi:DNA-binding PadR family transcriptional regulator
MNSARLFVLGMLARGGPMHGHQIRRAAQIDRTELWADVKPGSLYGALHRLEAEGVIRALRTEQEGNRPARTIYEITPDGRAELLAQRDEALRHSRLRPDPIDLALEFTGDLPVEELRAVLEERRTALAAEQASWLRLRAIADPYLSPMDKMTFRHTLLRLETELTWHDELLEQLPTLLEDGRRKTEDGGETASQPSDQTAH